MLITLPHPRIMGTKPSVLILVLLLPEQLYVHFNIVFLTHLRALLLFSAVTLVVLPSTSAFLRESGQRIKLQRIDAANMALDTLHVLGLPLI
jgi:hypothetical protein